MTKRCSNCDTHKPHDEFHRNASKKDGLSKWCKDCNKEWANSNYVDRHLHQCPTVYVLTCIPTGEQYVGSTTQSLEKRLWGHRTSARAGRAANIHGCMRVFNKRKHWKIEALEIHTTDLTTEELREREQFWIERLNSVLNTNNAVRQEAA